MLAVGTAFKVVVERTTDDSPDRDGKLLLRHRVAAAKLDILEVRMILRCVPEYAQVVRKGRRISSLRLRSAHDARTTVT